MNERSRIQTARPDLSPDVCVCSCHMCGHNIKKIMAAVKNRYSYLQLRAGQDGEHIGNLFLKDYSQYSPHLFYVS